MVFEIRILSLAGQVLRFRRFAPLHNESLRDAIANAGLADGRIAVAELWLVEPQVRPVPGIYVPLESWRCGDAGAVARAKRAAGIDGLYLPPEPDPAPAALA